MRTVSYEWIRVREIVELVPRTCVIPEVFPFLLVDLRTTNKRRDTVVELKVIPKRIRSAP